MKNIGLSIIFAALLSALGSSVAHAAPAGRVLVAVGDTVALRNGVEIKLARGDAVQSGDTLRVGEASNMQVRFTDEGIAALRSNSVLRIDDYQFEDKAGAGKSFLSLVKGGMRAITGLIGHKNRDNYAVRAVTATIGVRGTNFVLAQCNNDCFNKDGSKADNGLFGGVTEGRIAVSNQAGEKEFGRNEFFHVSSSEALPKPLLAPPSFLRDQLEGQAKSKESKPSADTGIASAGESGGTVAAAPAPATSEVTQPVLQTVQFVPAQQDVVQTNLGVSTGSYSYSYTLATANAGIFSGGFGPSPHSFSEAFIKQGVLSVIDPAKLSQYHNEFFAQIVTSQTPALTFLTNAYSVKGTSEYYRNYDQFDNPIGAAAGTVNFSWVKTAATNTGSNASAGNLSWGRHTETDQGTFTGGPDAGQTYSDTRYEHWATGDQVNFAALPTTGTYSYAWIGGTNPTDQQGAVGTFTGTGSTVGVQFTGAGGANISLAGAAWTMPSGSNYSLSFSNKPVSLAQTDAYRTSTAGWTDTGTRTIMTPIITTAGCTGGGCPGSSVTATVSGMLFGATATGLAAGISTAPTIQPVGGTGEYTASVQAYRR